MHIFGIIIGWVIVIGYFVLVMNYFVKVINRNLIIKKAKDTQLQKKYVVFMSMITKSHVYIPIYLITVILLHFLIELVHQGFFITGLIVTGLMFLQIAIGVYGLIVKNREKGLWFYAHRTVAALLAIAIIAHIASVVALHAAGGLELTIWR